jgi:hypothetical protein
MFYLTGIDENSFVGAEIDAYGLRKFGTLSLALTALELIVWHCWSVL